MEEPQVAFANFQAHFDRSEMADKTIFTVLELGPSDSLYTALIASAFSASSVFLVDIGAFATEDINWYQAMAKHLYGLRLSREKLLL